MNLQTEYVGKVSLTPEGWWSAARDYDVLSLVTQDYKPNEMRSYVSKRPVPAGTLLTNEDYWMPLAAWLNAVCVCKTDLDKLFAGEVDIPNVDWCDHSGDGSNIPSDVPDDDDDVCCTKSIPINEDDISDILESGKDTTCGDCCDCEEILKPDLYVMLDKDIS